MDVLKSLHFGFSYVGLVYLLMLMVPNLIWTKFKPEDYEKYAAKENKILGAFERAGEVLVSTSAVVFSDFNFRPWTLWYLWFFASFLLMILYEIYWCRYFKSGKTMKDFYGSLLGIPVPGASLPVAAFLLLSVYGKNVILLVSTIILGIGHIGIHLEHAREMEDTPCAE